VIFTLIQTLILEAIQIQYLMARGIHCECLTNGTVQQTIEIIWPCCGIQSSEHAVVGLFLFLTK